MWITYYTLQCHQAMRKGKPYPKQRLRREKDPKTETVYSLFGEILDGLIKYWMKEDQRGEKWLWTNSKTVNLSRTIS